MWHKSPVSEVVPPSKKWGWEALHFNYPRERHQMACLYLDVNGESYSSLQAGQEILTSPEGEKKSSCASSALPLTWSFYRCNLEKPRWEPWCFIPTSAVRELSSLASFSILVQVALVCMLGWLVV